MTRARAPRRLFFAQSGALVAAIMLPPASAARASSSATAVTFGQRIEIHPDGRVLVRIGRIEMGQGLNTAIAQLAAEELDVAVGRIAVAPVDTATAPDEGYTDASASMRTTGVAVRQAGARVRAALLQLARRRSGADLASMHVEDGTIFVAGRPSTTYWQLLADSPAHVTALPPAPLKPPAQYGWIGKAVANPDLLAKVMGQAVFIHDLRLPGMLHARVLRPPSLHASLASVDVRAADGLPGITRVVRRGGFVAVVAQREDQAETALARLRLASRWNDTLSPMHDGGVAGHLRQEAGMVRAASDTGRLLSADYDVPYRMHGAIGPSCAVAYYVSGQLTVWSHAQGMYPLRNALASLTGLPVARILCIHRQGAGCYGHNGADDAAADAALIAMACAGQPVRVQWMREDEHQWEPYGPAMAMRISGAVDARGRITTWDYTAASPTHSTRPGGAGRLLAQRQIDGAASSGLWHEWMQWGGGAAYNAKPYYNVPAQVTTHLVRRAPLRTSALRGLGAYANVYAIEGFMDELARAAARDPLAFRLDHLDDPRARAVLELAARHYGWADRHEQAGHGHAIAFARLNNYGAYVAVAMQAHAVGERVRILRAVAAVDCGEVINPDGVRNQIEGGVVQAMGWTLLEAVAFADGRVTSVDWATYPILRMTEAPEIQVHLLDQPGTPYLGVGEAAQGPAGAATAIAAAAALGRQVRSLPVSRGR